MPHIKAVRISKSNDTVIVHSGIYRECVRSKTAAKVALVSRPPEMLKPAFQKNFVQKKIMHIKCNYKEKLCILKRNGRNVSLSLSFLLNRANSKTHLYKKIKKNEIKY